MKKHNSTTGLALLMLAITAGCWITAGFMVCDPCGLLATGVVSLVVAYAAAQPDSPDA